MVEKVRIDEGTKQTIFKVSVVAVIGVIVYVITSVLDKKKAYEEAARLFAEKDYAKARSIFRSLGDYKLSKDYQAICTKELGDDWLDEDEEEDAFFENLED